MKKCSSCGATYNDSTNFCSSCGTRLTVVSAQRSRHPGHKKKQHRLVGCLAVPAVILILVLSTVFIFFYRKEYKPLIVDHNPSVYTYEDLLSDTDLLKSRYSSVFSADSLGETADGRQILHFIIGNEDASRKVLVNGGIHAREYITCQLVMKQTVSFLKHIKSGDSYGDISYKDLLQDTAIHVICMVNPDGVSISQQGLDGIPDTHLPIITKERHPDVKQKVMLLFSLLYRSTFPVRSAITHREMSFTGISARKAVSMTRLSLLPTRALLQQAIHWTLIIRLLIPPGIRTGRS